MGQSPTSDSAMTSTTVTDSICSPGLNLALRFRRLCSKVEVTAVGVSPSSSAAYAVYTAAQTAQSWIDVFDLTNQRGYSKTSGSHAAFSPQGNRFATVRDWTVQLAGGVEYHHNSTVLLRDGATGKTAGELKEADGAPIAWNGDGRILAAGEANNRMSIWDVRTGTRVGRVMSHIDAVTHAAFMPDNSLVTISRDGTLRITNPTTAKTLRRLEIENSTNPRCLAVSADGRRIVSVWDTTVHVWLPQTNDLTSYNLNSVRRNEGWPLCISPDCRYMTCRTEDGFDIMDIASGEVVFARDEDVIVTSAAFAADGKTLVFGKMDGNVEVWDVRDDKL
ncbi:quinon protein alcohol dehydrogenase-like superfamily [Ilyonectria robusta]|uniref:quinon protein alcohol dehydrogenase-like superfamily n=1 Tax=Ilyonectria robusta TaxID=1079257 RepID=UPI001E8D3E93|nr:quinon protein alcohol dehydrogenase-like superfamily [Ilyonectria robusta]KAH8738145.1 quinon protein alcohol dehydrogenase-like superfamily [Ilyonectria robusta]